jgi:hypothetical protein
MEYTLVRSEPHRKVPIYVPGNKTGIFARLEVERVGWLDGKVMITARGVGFQIFARKYTYCGGSSHASPVIFAHIIDEKYRKIF